MDCCISIAPVQPVPVTPVSTYTPHNIVIGKMLDTITNTVGPDNKTLIVIMLFDYIVDEALDYVTSRNNFKRTVIKKCYEFKKTVSHRTTLIESIDRVLTALGQPLVPFDESVVCRESNNQPIYQALMDKAASYPDSTPFHAAAYKKAADTVADYHADIYDNYDRFEGLLLIPGVTQHMFTFIRNFIYNSKTLPVEPVESVAVESVAIAVAVAAPVEPVESVAPVESVEPVEPVESVELIEPVATRESPLSQYTYKTIHSFDRCIEAIENNDGSRYAVICIRYEYYRYLNNDKIDIIEIYDTPLYNTIMYTALKVLDALQIRVKMDIQLCNEEKWLLNLLTTFTNPRRS